MTFNVAIAPGLLVLFVSCLFIAAFLSHRVAKKTISSRIEPAVKDPLLQPSSSVAWPGQDVQLGDVSDPHRVVRSHELGIDVVLESAHFPGGVYFSDLPREIQQEILNLEHVGRVRGDHVFSFLYQSQPLPPNASVYFIYGVNHRSPETLLGYCVIED